MNALAFAWRSLVRQPARATLGVLGVAAVGALLFDMLMLSRGLVLSMRDVLDRVGFDVRVMATPSMPPAGAGVSGAASVAAALSALPEVDEAVPIRLATAQIEVRGRKPQSLLFVGTDPSRRRPWTLLSGRDVRQPGEALVNENLANLLRLEPGGTVTFRGVCSSRQSALPPVTFRVAGVARFPFDAVDQLTAGTGLRDFARACGEENSDTADMLLVASIEGAGADAARDAIARFRPDLYALTNEQVVGRFAQVGFSYFRQISTVLATVTVGFGLLLIAVLLTVSVNQRLGEIAALRALGFSQRRVVADVLCESALIVGIGGGLSLPVGTALAVWLDTILKRMPGIPADLHFFVFEPRALGIHIALMVTTAVLAALYPMRLVARLPIAATLRNEAVS
jgi:ABC-type lipoprotein release transport system permease subunit